MESTALVTGFMVAASAFITVAGIILATGGKERLGKMSSGSLLVSLAFGIALIVKALGRLDNPSDSMQTLWILLTLQIITFYLPMWSLIYYRDSIREGENMLSEENKERNTKMDSLADEYMQKYIPNATVDQFENLAIAFTYKQTKNLISVTKNLVKETEKLKYLTRALFVTTFLLLVAAIIEIVIVLVGE